MIVVVVDDQVNLRMKIIVLQQVMKIKQILYQNEVMIKMIFKLVVGDQNIRKVKNKLQKK